jgi:hypothetical protein
MTTVANFGEVHFGQAQLGDPRRTRRLVRLANQIYRHPGGTLPAKLHEPKDYKAMDRLMNRPEATHTALLEPHRQQTLARMRQADHVVLVLHDTTELDYSGLRSITDLGPIGGSLNRGYRCHYSLAFDPGGTKSLGWPTRSCTGAAPSAARKRYGASANAPTGKAVCGSTASRRSARPPTAAAGCTSPTAAPTPSSSWPSLGTPAIFS